MINVQPASGEIDILAQKKQFTQSPQRYFTALARSSLRQSTQRNIRVDVP